MKNIPVTTAETFSKVEEIDWQDVYDHSLPRVFHYFCYKVGDPIVAEELTAITFEEAWKSRGNFRKDVGQVQAWLSGIARNVISDHFRKKSREIPLEDIPESDFSYSVEDNIQRDQTFQAIMASLNKFPDRERELVALKYGAELTNREIACMTGLSESNVGTILNRVVAKLRNEWEKNHE